MTAIYFSIGALGVVAGAAIASGYCLAKWREALGVKVTDYGTEWSDYVARCLELSQENNRLEAHIDFNRDLFAEIHAQGVNSTSGTAQSMAAKAAGGMAK